MGYSHGKIWTDENIKTAIYEVMRALEISRMPSRKECDEYYGSCGLSNAISRKGGFYALANSLNLPIKNSETGLGKRMEAVARNILESKGFKTKQMSVKFPYDVLVNDFIKIDVKSSHLYHGSNGNFYTFNLEKKYATCDIYLLITLTTDNNVLDIYVIPSKFVMNITQISVGEIKSKYNRFKNRWDYITSFSEYLASIV